MLGLGNNISKKMNLKANPIPALIKQYKTRVLADGGTFEAESCLLTFLNEIN